jgi:hypothetical protein
MTWAPNCHFNLNGNTTSPKPIIDAIGNALTGKP